MAAMAATPLVGSERSRRGKIQSDPPGARNIQPYLASFRSDAGIA
jgi:hypothetical protein